MTSQHTPAPHLRAASEVTLDQAVDPGTGLDNAQAQERLQTFGPNTLSSATRRGPWALLLEQFQDFMVLVLLAAAVISGLIGDIADTLVILAIVVMNAVIGFAQSWRADRALDALKDLASAKATVLREGVAQVLPASDVVPGDIVLLEAGNQVPADLRLVQATQLQIDESALTGESITVAKNATALCSADDTALGDRINMAFKGTTVTKGRASGVVVATGMATELGRVARLLDIEDRSTPLQLRLAAFGKRLALLVIGICIVVFSFGLMRGEEPLLMALTAISLAVAAIPEALPAVASILLALGAHRMVRVNALIRRLPSVETLGSITTICSDKTGTLTQNSMVVEVMFGDGQRWTPDMPALTAIHEEILRAGVLCNDAQPAPHDAASRWRGDPTETALLEVAFQMELHKTALDQAWPRVHEQPFDSERKRMTTFHADGGSYLAYTKGAPESVLPLCTLQWAQDEPTPLSLDAVMREADALAAQGLRVLALARRTHAALPEGGGQDTEQSGMHFLGLMALMDPPRAEALAAVKDCIAAGITPIMITGDHPATARAIAQRLSILGGEHQQVLTGRELAQLDDAALAARVQDLRVYARVDPAQKIRIVEALQAQGHVVAMTGDGVNDAPALKRADIGVSMGRSGTDVAREASSMVLLDDNFATVVGAVREGRRIYDNIRKFVRYAMTGNSGEIWTLFLAPLFFLPIPLLPIHILWVNLVTDGLPGLALAAEPAERGVMRRPPRAQTESLFAGGMWQHILIIGLLIGGLCLGIQAWALANNNPNWQTMVFTVLTLSQMAHVMTIRSERDSLLRQGLTSNLPLLGAVLLTFLLQMAIIYIPALNPIFKTAPLSLGELGICLAAALLVGVAVEAEKWWRRK